MVSRNSLQDLCSGPEFAIGEMYAIRQFRSRTDKDGKFTLTAVMHEEEEWAPGTNTARCTASATSISKAVYDTLKDAGKEALAAGGIEISHRSPIQNRDYKAWPAPSALSSASVTFNSGSGGKITQAVSGKLYVPSEMRYGGNTDSYWLKHTDAVIPKPSCTCGFYAYHDLDALAENAYDATFTGVVRVHGRIVVGEKGLRAEKAEIVALVPGNYAAAVEAPGKTFAKAVTKHSVNNYSMSFSFNTASVSPALMQTLFGVSTMTPETQAFLEYLNPSVYVHDGTSFGFSAFVLDGYFYHAPSGRPLFHFFKPSFASSIATLFEKYYYVYRAHKWASQDVGSATFNETHALESVKNNREASRESEYLTASGAFGFIAAGVPAGFTTGNVFAGVGVGVLGASASLFVPKLLYKMARRRYGKSVVRSAKAQDKLTALTAELAQAREALVQSIEDSRYAYSPTTSPSATAEQKTTDEDVTERVNRSYPSVPVFSSVEKMLQEFPLTGPDDFRDSASED